MFSIISEFLPTLVLLQVGQLSLNRNASLHIISVLAVNYLSFKGQCVIQTSRNDFGREEFLALVNECGLNRLLLYVPWLTNLIDIARKDAVVFDALKSLRQICYTGASMNPEDKAWLMKMKIPATVSTFRSSAGGSSIY